MDEENSDQQLSAEVTPTSSENDLLADKSEDSLDEDDDNDDDENDIDKMLSELQNFQEELEQTSQRTSGDEKSPAAALTYLPPSHPLDEFRFSLTTIEGSGEVDLDALLEDLCIMEKDMNSGSETESIFSEMLPSPKLNSPISPTVKVSADVLSRLESVQEETRELTPEEQQERIKAEKIRIALEKLRAARVKKLVIKVYNDEDPTSKTIAIDQTWTAWEVCKKMMRKNDTEPDPNWVLVERIPQLSLERLLEDHESVVDVVSSWPWDSENKLVINNRREKYALFRNPQNFLLTSDTSSGASQLAEKSKDILLQEFFQKDAMRLPELDGVLYLKEGKKSWKKHYFALRASGIYYTPKGKTKSSRDIVCLMKFEHVSIYNGVGFKKKLKAPTDHCFVLKHFQCQEFDAKTVRCLCAEDLRTLQRWVVAIRLAIFGYKMLVDYSETQDEMDKLAFTLDRNKFSRASSFSAGQSTESEIKPQTETKDYQSMKAKTQSERIKETIGPSSIHPSGSMSFSIKRSQIEAKKPSKKIGNLFSDAWKKGNEAESQIPAEPISPDTPSVHSTGAATPNTLNPKPFNVDNIGLQPLEEIKEETRNSDQVEVVAQHSLQLDPPPLPRKSFSNKPQVEEEQNQIQENNKGGKEEEESRELVRKHRSSSKRSRKTRDVSPPPPPPPPPSVASPPPPPSPSITSPPPPSPPSVISSFSHSVDETHIPISITSSDGNSSPPPPPLPPKSPSTQLSPSLNERVVFDDLFPPPPTGTLSGSGDYLPPLPPSQDFQDEQDVDLPPPPPEVLFKEKLRESLSNGRRRTASGGNEPPAVPPKTVSGRPRLNSSGKPVPPTPPRTSSSSFSSSP